MNLKSVAVEGHHLVKARIHSMAVMHDELCVLYTDHRQTVQVFRIKEEGITKTVERSRKIAVSSGYNAFYIGVSRGRHYYACDRLAFDIITCLVAGFLSFTNDKLLLAKAAALGKISHISYSMFRIEFNGGCI
jgi:hypothetical protein